MEERIERFVHVLLSIAIDDEHDVRELGQEITVKRYHEGEPRIPEHGLVLTMQDGSEFQITILQSRQARS